MSRGYLGSPDDTSVLGAGKSRSVYDHQALKWILSSSDASRRLARWRLRLIEHDSTVLYKELKKNQTAGAPPRLLTTKEAALKAELEIPCFFVSPTTPAPLRRDLTLTDSRRVTGF